MSHKSVLIICIVALASAAAGIGLYKFVLQPDVNPSAANKAVKIQSTTTIGHRRPDFSMLDVEGKKLSMSDFDGKVIIVNFWATWCPPCRREIPAFIKLYDQYENQGFTIIGIALDSQQAAMDFVDPMGINYPILVGEMEGIALSQAYGNQLSVLPYTVIIDRKGIIRHAFTRELTFEEAEKLIKPFL